MEQAKGFGIMGVNIPTQPSLLFFRADHGKAPVGMKEQGMENDRRKTSEATMLRATKPMGEESYTRIKQEHYPSTTGVLNLVPRGTGA